MTRSDLIEQIASQNSNFSKRDIEILVNTLFQNISDCLAKGEKIEIRGFGSFKVKDREGRMGRNPKSGENIKIESKNVPFFKAGKELKERVNKL